MRYVGVGEYARSRSKSVHSSIDEVSELFTRTNPSNICWTWTRDSRTIWRKCDAQTGANTKIWRRCAVLRERETGNQLRLNATRNQPRAAVFQINNQGRSRCWKIECAARANKDGRNPHTKHSSRSNTQPTSRLNNHNAIRITIRLK